MNIKSIVVIILRVYSLNFLFMGLLKSMPTIMAVAIMYREMDEGFSWAPEIVIPYVIMFIFFLVGIAFWIFAHPLADLITRKLPKDIKLGTFDLTNSYTIAFLVLGLFFAVSEFPNALYWGFHIFKLAASRSGDSWKQEVNFYRVLSDVIPFAIGLAMVFKARLWAEKLERFHIKRENSE